ncbi:SAM-dependent methyltransferase [Actinomadura verrucosospora]|uniref:OmpR/PhoB-type domain-containing protein n=1 Tax=Actinomadura verrucosospora TaxID=46165 RepID=A0A7D3W5R2_ACTVE|nr:SAM-dependent methyltransferase [Actinomadura verrucosospora]QKG27112.1 hypothetical protein ACTIVE_8765 [Actinomadura verrucosospora]
MREAEEPCLEITLLKGISVRAAGEPVRLATQQLHLVFALLAGHGEGSAYPVSDDRLLELVWGDPGKRSSMHTAMSRLRRPFGPHRIAHDAAFGGGYTFRVHRGERVDLWAWRGILDTCTRMYHSDPYAAVIVASDALKMCDLTALRSLPSTPAMDTVVEGIVNDYLTTAARLAEVQLAVGDHDAVTAALPPLVRRYGDHEHLRGLLMSALYRSGRPDQALDLYDEVAAQRAARGRRPSAALSLLRHRILNGDPTLLQVTPPPRPAADKAVLAAGGDPRMSTDRMEEGVAAKNPDDPATFTTASDRAGVVRMCALLPEVPRMIEESAEFAELFARKAAAELGVSRFLSLSAPSPLTLHRVARLACTTGAHVVYAHREPSLVRHHRRLLPIEQGVEVVEGTIRDPRSLLAEPAVRDLFGLDKPFDEREPVAILDRNDINRTPRRYDMAELYGELMASLPARSVLGLVAVTEDGMAPLARAQIEATYRNDPHADGIVHRSHTELQQCVPDGMELLPPGIDEVHRYLPSVRSTSRRNDPWRHYALIAVKR